MPYFFNKLYDIMLVVEPVSANAPKENCFLFLFKPVDISISAIGLPLIFVTGYQFNLFL